MQVNLTNLTTVTLLASKLATFGHDIETEKTFIMSALNRLGKTFKDEDFNTLKHSFEIMGQHMDDVLPEIRGLVSRLIEYYDALKAAKEASPY
jgi:hypothetical protein